MSQPLPPLTKPTVALDLKKLNQKFENLHPRDILAWCVTSIPTGLVQTSTFDVDDLLITDLLYRKLKPAQPVPVLFLDTLHHFPETLELVARAKAIYQLELKVCRMTGVASRKAFAAKYGEALWRTNLEKFHALTKTEPLQQGLTELRTVAQITGRRRDEPGDRANLPIFAFDSQKRLQVNPLANWTRTETWAYVFEHDLVYNPLHDRGYSIIGDEPLTTAIDRNEHKPG